jgi:hypothetical protein
LDILDLLYINLIRKLLLILLLTFFLSACGEFQQKVSNPVPALAQVSAPISSDIPEIPLKHDRQIFLEFFAGI